MVSIFKRLLGTKQKADPEQQVDPEQTEIAPLFDINDLIEAREAEGSSEESKPEEYDRLARMHQERGDLAEAEEFFVRALALNAALGRTKEMAIQYSEIVIMRLQRGNSGGAASYFLEALALEEELGNKQAVAGHYGNLGVAHTGGNFDEAQKYYLKSIAMYEELGSKIDLGAQYANLAELIARQGDDSAKACGYFAQAKAMFEDCGAADCAEQVAGWMDNAGCP